MKIINPETNKQNNVTVFDVNMSEMIRLLNASGVKAVSFHLLDQQKALAKRQQYGESANSNFALNIFENALDYALGQTVMNIALIYQANGKRYPRNLKIAANRKGDVFILMPSGRVWNDDMTKVVDAGCEPYGKTPPDAQ